MVPLSVGRGEPSLALVRMSPKDSTVSSFTRPLSIPTRYAPLTPDGYGACYGVYPDFFRFCLSSSSYRYAGWGVVTKGVCCPTASGVPVDHSPFVLPSIPNITLRLEVFEQALVDALHDIASLGGNSGGGGGGSGAGRGGGTKLASRL